MRTLQWLVLPAALALSACGGAGGGGGGGGTAREFTRSDSAVTVLPNANPGFTATRTVTLSNDDGGASAAVVSLADRVGSVTSSSSATAGYQIQVTLRADAPSEAQAREALDTMTVVHEDSLGSDTLYLDHEVLFANYNAPNVSRRADVTASLPGALAYRLYQGTDVGDTGSSGLSGSTAQLRADVGDVTLTGTWNSAEADSDTGDVTVGGDVAALAATADTGDINVVLPGTRNAQAVLDSSTGSVDVTVGRTTGTVFDLEGYTQVGSVAIVVAGTSPVGTQTDEHGHYRSSNYSSGTPRVDVLGRTSVGSVTIHE